MHYWHQHQHYTYGGRGHGRPGGESEGPPSGLRWLRPSGSDPGASTSLWPSPPQLDLQREVRLSIFEKSNTAILRAVCDLEVWFFWALGATFSARPSEWEGVVVPFSLDQVQLCNLNIFHICHACLVFFDLDIQPAVLKSTLTQYLVHQALTWVYLNFYIPTCSLFPSALHFFDLDGWPEVL